MKGENGERTIITGDLNARHIRWDRMTNARGRAVFKCAKRWNYKIKPPGSAS